MLTGKTISQLNPIDQVYDSLDLPIQYGSSTYKLTYDQLKKSIADYITAVTPTVTATITKTPNPTPTPSVTNCNNGCRQYVITNYSNNNLILEYYNCDNIYQNLFITGLTTGYTICSSTYPVVNGFSDDFYNINIGNCCFPSTPTPTSTKTPTPTPTITITKTQNPTPTPTPTDCSSGCRQYTLSNLNPYSVVMFYYDCDNNFKSTIFTGNTSGLTICSQNYPTFSSPFSGFQVDVQIGSCCYPSSPTPTPTKTSTPTPTVTPTPTNCAFGVYSSTTATTLSVEPVSFIGSANTQSYQLGGTRFYIYGYNQDASGINGGGIYPYLQVPNNFTQNIFNWGQQFWAPYFSGTTLISEHTSFSRTSIWPTNYQNILNTWVGISQCFTTVSAGTYWIGIGADNDFRLYIDGSLIVDTTQALQPVGYANSEIPFTWWHVYPFYFTQGDHRIQIAGWNRPTGGGAPTIFALACEIYDQSIESLTAATSVNDLNVIYSTSGVTSAETFQYYTGSYLPVGVTCPSGYTYYCGQCYQYAIVCPSQTPTPTPTNTPSSTVLEPTPTPTITLTQTPKSTETPTPTPTITLTPTNKG